MFHGENLIYRFGTVQIILEQQQDRIELEEISSVPIEFEEETSPFDPAKAIPLAVPRKWLPLSLSFLATCCCALIVWYYFAAHEKVMESTFIKYFFSNGKMQILICRKQKLPDCN